MPTVSAIIPTFNRLPYLKKAVASILAQSYQDLELIVVDDGSTDGTESYLESIKDKRVRFLRIKRTGVAGARNAGCREAKGKYLAFCDSDDLWLVDRLKLQMELFAEKVEPVLVFADAGVMLSERKTDRTIFQSQAPFNNDVFFRLLLDNYIPTSTVTILKAAFEKTPGFEAVFTPAEDYRLWLRICRLGKAEYLDRPLAWYRKHQFQIGRELSVMFPACADVIRSALDEAGKSVDEYPGLDERLWKLHFVAARSFMAAGDEHSARMHYGFADNYKTMSRARIFKLLSYIGI